MSADNVLKLGFNDITVIILAGGQGKRLGNRNKGLLELNSTQLIELCISKLQKFHNKILISANSDVKSYETYQLPIVKDQYDSFQGPLSGILSCRPYVSTPLTLVVPVDSPRFPSDYSSKMLASYQEQTDICVAFDGIRQQNLFLLFKTALFNDMEDYFNQGQRSVRHWLQRHKCTIVDFSDSENCFFNINTPEDLKMAKKL